MNLKLPSILSFAFVGATEIASAQTSPSTREPAFGFGFTFEGSTYLNPGRNPSGVEDRNFRPGFFLGAGVGGSYRLVGPDDPNESGLRIQPWAQFRYRARWQVGLDSFPFQPASYVLDAGTDFSYRFRRHDGNQHRAIVRFSAQHHSNGAGEHCTFNPDTWTTAGRDSCTTPYGDLAAQLNREQGDYTSNRYGFSLIWQMFHHGARNYFLSAGFSPEFQCVGAKECFGIENMSDRQADVFGRASLPIFAQTQITFGDLLLRSELGAAYYFGSDSRLSPLRVWNETMLLWPSLHGFGFVFRGNFGRDFQHMLAVDSGVNLSLGITFNTQPIENWMSIVR